MNPSGVLGFGSRRVHTGDVEFVYLKIPAGRPGRGPEHALHAALEAAAELGCDVVLMHMQGDPRTMQAEPHYADVVAAVAALHIARAAAPAQTSV